MKKHKTIALYISIGIFAFSLTQETFYINREGDRAAWANGFGNLLFGLFSGNSSWFANLFIIPAWIVTYKNSLYPIILSLIAFSLAVSFYFHGDIVGNTAGHIEFATNYLIGYWLWLLSMSVYLIYHIIIFINTMKNSRSMKFLKRRNDAL